MHGADLLLRLAAILVAARVAAEIAQRLRQPVVLFEIAAGVLLGPSVLGLARPGEVLSFLAELGAVLLLFEIGMHMDLGDLRRVGGAALRVASIGVVLPFALGFAGARAVGIDPVTAMFLAAGITATSVGITARVFADAHALASAEARIVLGAALVDDVMGLVILTVVTRMASEGSVAAGSVVAVVATAAGFLVAAVALGAGLAPRIFAAVRERSRTEGALVVLALGVALAFAGAAALAKLAPIVGAFVAGVAVGRSDAREELQRRLAPVGHLFIPVFFLAIGIDARVDAFSDPWVLGVAAVLVAAGVAGKLAAGWGVARGAADRVSVGIGMIPRGEVGLIFAGIGLAEGALDARSHAALIVVVMVTTIVAPPWLRRRLERPRAKAETGESVAPPGGWLRIGEDEVELGARPPLSLRPRLALDAALACAERRPGPALLDWLGAPPREPVEWDDDLRAAFVAVLRDGTVRSWRLLEVTGVLDELAPELSAAVRRRMGEPFDLDPSSALRWERLESLHGAVSDPEGLAGKVWRTIGRQDLVLLAAHAASAFEGSQAATLARGMAKRMGLPDEEAATVGALVEDRDLLAAAAARPSFGAEEEVLDLAAHVGGRAAGVYVLAAAGSSGSTEREAVDELFGLLTEAIARPEAAGESLIRARREEIVAALRHRIPERELRRFLEAAPRRYLLAHDAATIGRHLIMSDPRPVRYEVRVEAEPLTDGTWIVHVVTLDRRGALAAIAGALGRSGARVLEASIATSRDGLAIDLFHVAAPSSTDWGQMAEQASWMLTGGLPEATREVVEGAIEIDDRASPWHTIVELRAADRIGLLHRVALAFANAGLQIHHATVRTVDGEAVDTFLVTDRDGHKLDGAGARDLLSLFSGRRERSRVAAP